MERCRGECRLQITRITNHLIVGSYTDPENLMPRPDPWLPKGVAEGIGALLMLDIIQWAQPVVVSSSCNHGGCECRQTQKITDADWAKCETLTRTWAKKISWGGKNWEVRIDVEYQVAYAAAACENPSREKFYVTNSGFDAESGYAVVAAADVEVSDAMMKRLGEALG